MINHTMSIIHTTIAILVLLFIGIDSKGNHLLQDSPSNSYRPISSKTYDQVLDILFRQNEFLPNKAIWSIVIRFKPSSGVETQIVIRRKEEKVEVISFTPKNGSIYSQLNSILKQTGIEDAIKMAKEIEIERKEIKTSLRQVNYWHTSLFRSISQSARQLSEYGKELDKTGKESFVVHGAIYDCWYEHLLNKMSFSLYDVGDSQNTSMARYNLVKWMNILRHEVEQLK